MRSRGIGEQARGLGEQNLDEANSARAWIRRREHSHGLGEQTKCRLARLSTSSSSQIAYPELISRLLNASWGFFIFFIGGEGGWLGLKITGDIIFICSTQTHSMRYVSAPQNNKHII